MDDHGACTDQLPELDVGAAVLTPAHQFPLGARLSPDRRATLVAWAHAHDAWIFEDDYDAEYRFDGQPVGSLQGLAPDRVATSSSVSKTLAPGLRLGWLVLPPDLIAVADAQASTLGEPGPCQWALAQLMASGDYDRHVRRQRRVYKQRRQELDRLLARFDALEACGTRAGLHLTVAVKRGGRIALGRHQAQAQRAGVAMASLADFEWFRSDPAAKPALVIGYTALPSDQWRPALAALGRVLNRALA